MRFACQRSFPGEDSGTVTITSQSLQPTKLLDGLPSSLSSSCVDSSIAFAFFVRS